MKYSNHLRVRLRSEQVPFGTKLIPFGLNQLELDYFVLRLGWTVFGPDLIGTGEFEDGNKNNGDVDDASKN